MFISVHRRANHPPHRSMDGIKNDMCSALLEAGGGATPEPSRNECVVRVVELRRMLESTAFQTIVEPIELPLVLDTHRGFLLKEMAWMAADFRVGLYFFRETTQYNAEETIKGTGQLKLKR